jgi:hypothetical protein
MIPTIARAHRGWRRIRRVPDPDCLRSIRDGARLTRRAIAERAGVRKEFVPEPDQARIRECVQKLRALLAEYEEAGYVAFALVGSELQDEAPL